MVRVIAFEARGPGFIPNSFPVSFAKSWLEITKNLPSLKSLESLLSVLEKNLPTLLGAITGSENQSPNCYFSNFCFKFHT